MKGNLMNKQLKLLLEDVITVCKLDYGKFTGYVAPPDDVEIQALANMGYVEDKGPSPYPGHQLWMVTPTGRQAVQQS